MRIGPGALAGVEEAARFLYADLQENVLLVKVLAGEQAYRTAADGRASSRASDERASVWSAVKR